MLIKRFVLKYIREHMSHETGGTRDQIFEAINDGCSSAFREDNVQTRLSWMFGELIKHDKGFQWHLERDTMVPECVASATYSEVSDYVANHKRFEAEAAQYRAKQLINKKI